MYSMIVILIIMFLASCSTATQSYDQLMSKWQGKSVSQLVRQAGQPSVKIATATGGAYYAYITPSNPFYPQRSVPGATMAVSAGKPVIVQNGTTVPYINLKCTTIFEVDSSQTIVGAQSKGSCRVIPRLTPPN